MQELGMPVKPLKEAKSKVESLCIPLQDHLIKLCLFGDRADWRNEVYAFSEQIYNIRVNLKSRSRLTKQEYLDQMTEYSYPSEMNSFNNAAGRIFRELNPKMPQVRPTDEAMGKVHYLQFRLADLWSRNEYSENIFSKILDVTLHT